MTYFARALYVAAWTVFVLANHALGADAGKLPPDFVYLRDAAPSIVQDMRYATPNNFTGKLVPGYDAPECVLKRSAALALKRAQAKAGKLGYSLKVYDCYRPVRAVKAFMAWASTPDPGATKGYYPHLKKSQLVPGYIASRSQHSTGAAVDLTLIRPGAAPRQGEPQESDCTAPMNRGESLDMGTAFDCFDPKANTASPVIAAEQRKNRSLLLDIMKSAGFKNYAAEWWHFSYPSAGGAKRYDFPIEPRPLH